ncbi:uncharacterized protein M6B38_120120 [Iris pallida]|uniref:Uncharacterized protein n=1 Tax=Iris pallida TaxID=29817 RepID=A0AAX6H9J1_IRIPA|nr:uncharacterized protein M6B38_120120 [Iris pallida]
MFDSPAASRHRAFISPSMSAPTFPTFSTPSSSRSPSPNPNPNPNPNTSSFSHNGRIAAALLPSAAVLLSLGGTPVLLTLALGLTVSYVLDLLRLPPVAPFLSVWMTLTLSQFAFFFSSSLPLPFLSLLLCALLTFLIGVWISLQFRFLQIENPAIVRALERLLFACLPIAVPPFLTFAAVSGLGIASAAYYLAAFCCVYYWLFSIPRHSSFKSSLDDGFILAPLECCVQSLFLLFVPVLFRIGSHHAVLFSSASSVCDLLLLFFIPFLFQLYVSTRGAMWWVTRDEYQIHRIRVWNGAVALVVVVVCLEIRVVFHSFARYLQVPPPMNYLLVTVAMLGGASAVGAYAVGMVQDAVGSAVFTAMAVLVSGAGAVVIGFPILLHTCSFDLWLLSSSIYNQEEFVIVLCLRHSSKLDGAMVCCA